MTDPPAPAFVLRSYESVRGQTENLVELSRTNDQMRLPDTSYVLNRVAPNLFATLNRCVFQCVLLLIRQLTEPAITRIRGESRLNSSMPGLLHVTFGERYETVVPELVSIVDRATRSAASSKTWADRLVAHSDLLTGLDEEPLPPLVWGMVPTTAAIIVEFLKAYETRQSLPLSGFQEFVLAQQLQSVTELLRGGVTP